MWWQIAAAGLGIYSAVKSGEAAKKTAAAAAADAERIRQEGRRRAADTRAALGAEIKSMRTLRSAGMPAHQAAAQIAFLQAKKGSERMARNRSMGRLAPEVRDAVFGGQFEQYVGREAQKSARYAQMTQAIFGMAKEQQSQVNQILGQADAGYAQGMQFSRQMEFEAGDPYAKAAGALAQGASLQAQQNAQMERLQVMMGAEAGAGAGAAGAAGSTPFTMQGVTPFPGGSEPGKWPGESFDAFGASPSNWIFGAKGNLPYT